MESKNLFFSFFKHETNKIQKEINAAIIIQNWWRQNQWKRFYTIPTNQRLDTDVIYNAYQNHYVNKRKYETDETTDTNDTSDISDLCDISNTCDISNISDISDSKSDYEGDDERDDERDERNERDEGNEARSKTTFFDNL